MQEKRWTRDDLKSAIIKSGIGFDELYGPSGESVFLTPRGARIIGIFPGNRGNSRNALWLHPKLEKILSEEVTDWVGVGAGSVGGDRLWVSPEKNFYYKKPSQFEGWFCPPEMDPGHYQRLSRIGKTIAYRNEFDLTDYSTGSVCRKIVMTRSFSPLPDCHSSIPAVKKGVVELSGVRTIEAIIFPKCDCEHRVQPWVLTQVPAGSQDRPGTVVIPVTENAQPIGYFGEIPADRLVKSSTHVSFRIDADYISKLGVRPEDLPPGRPAEIGYLLDDESEEGNTWFLARKTFHFPASQAECYDPAKADPNGPKGAIQSYNHGPSDGQDYPRFGEIEIQLSPTRQESDQWYARAVTELMGFYGPKEEILKVAQEVLRIQESIQLF